MALVVELVLVEVDVELVEVSEVDEVLVEVLDVVVLVVEEVVHS